MIVPKLLIGIGAVIILDSILKSNFIGATGYATVIVLCLQIIRNSRKKV